MKFKAALRYQLVELLQSAVAFCVIVGAVVVAVCILAGGTWFQMSILGFLVVVLLFRLPLSLFSDDMKYLLHMGLTRTQVYASSAVAFATMALLASLIEVACAHAFGPVWMGSSSFAAGLYGLQSLGVLVDFAWMFGANLAAALTALALAIVRVKVGKKWFLAGLAAVAILALLVIPAICEALFGNILPLAEGTAGLFGVTAAGADPTRALFPFAVAVVLAVLAGYFVVKRVEVRA
ncbi:MAG: hypothetical protein RR934_02975 [Gordonibacter sp.]|uniref:hypothetical protein n=1 Tax=Gordonibacter sp. TaxID=1968902 RepID=UPI00307338F8